ncbi:MAG: pyridoxal 5'-phosphate synthase glutaminase subunit PdxT [Candidatus Dormibacteraeota bacterium]|nr:pyridoxal 5'-phosphate synthase glutaminase subunit PdxT [Candidatus Dormibacteraeota bacterium]
MIGVLALQGAYREHVRLLDALDAATRLVRSRGDLEGLDGLVIPGGESTTMQILLERVGLAVPLRELIASGLPTLGTCAGLILLAAQITDGRPDQQGFGLLDVALRRNGYGRQVDSFEADLEIQGLAGKAFPGVFIRAPLVESVGPGAEVLAELAGHAVAVRQGRILGLAFHPELSGDERLHRVFLDLVNYGAVTA